MNPDRSLRIQFDQFIRNERTKLLAILVSKIGDIELAEDVLQEAFVKAWHLWQSTEIPHKPSSWLLKIAYNLAIDFIRRHQNFNAKQAQIIHLTELIHELNSHNNQDSETAIDERLKLIFICCHPALDQASQVALTLNTVCGLSTKQVAHAFLLKKTTLAQRLVRAKRKIKRSNIPFKIPENSELESRLNSLLSVIYLIFNQGYYATDNNVLIEESFCDEALYLAETLNQLLPQQAELLGLLALMQFHISRFKARTHCQHEITQLADQDRNLWNIDNIKQANTWFKQAIKLKSMGPYQIQAAISGVHSQASQFKHTDWQQIITLYKKLYIYQPTATVLINQATAMTFNNQAESALKLIDSIELKSVESYLPFHLAKAHTLKSLNKKSAAINFFSSAMSLSTNPKERHMLQAQIELIKG